MALNFTEHWIYEEQLQATADLAASTNDLPGDAIEIGVHQGLSAIFIADAIHPGILHAVDHWDWEDTLKTDGRIPDTSPESLALIGFNPEVMARDNYAIFLDNIAEGTQGNIKVHKMGWREFAKQWEGPVRFLHIDAVHTAKEVSDNIAALLPFAVPGAVFCGDDYAYPPVAEGVAEHFRKVNTGPLALWWVKI